MLNEAAALLPSESDPRLQFDIDYVRAVLARDQGRYQDSVQLLNALFDESTGLDRLRVATQLASLTWLQGDPAGAEPLYQHALQ